MNILVTGGHGLLGCEINFSNHNTFKPSKKELDVTDYKSLKAFVATKKIEKIIHCAALVGGVKANSSRNYDFFEQNILMNINVLRACREFCLNDSVFLLSTCIMPSTAPLPYTEEHLHLGEPHHTNFGYSYAKRILEVGSRSLKEQHGIKTTCIIPCNLYGKNDNYNLESGHVIPNLIHKCYLAKKNNTDFVIGGSGEPEREFMYVEDLARIIESEKFNDDLIIISPGKSHKIREVAELIANKMAFSGNISFDHTYPDGISKKPTNNSRFKKSNSNFEFTTLKNGIEKTIDHFISDYESVRK